MYRRDVPFSPGYWSSATGTWTLTVTPADRVDDLLEAFEVDLDEVLDVEPVQLPEDRLEAVVAARAVAAREEVLTIPDRPEPAVDLAGVDAAEDAPGGAARDWNVHDVAREAEHRDPLRLGVDRHHDQRVGVVEALVGSLVAADQQDVEALLAVPRRDDHVRQRRPDWAGFGCGGWRHARRGLADAGGGVR